MGACGPGPSGPPWALMGRALMGSPGPSWAVPLWAVAFSDVCLMFQNSTIWSAASRSPEERHASTRNNTYIDFFFNSSTFSSESGSARARAFQASSCDAKCAPVDTRHLSPRCRRLAGAIYCNAAKRGHVPGIMQTTQISPSRVPNGHGHMPTYELQKMQMSRAPPRCPMVPVIWSYAQRCFADPTSLVEVTCPGARLMKMHVFVLSDFPLPPHN